MKNALKLPFLFCLTIFILASCQQDSKQFSEYEQLQVLADAYDKTPSVDSGNSLIKELMNVMSSNKIEGQKQKQYLEYGLKVANEQKISTRKAGFLMALLKEDYDNPNTASRIFDLAEIMNRMKKPSVANTLTAGLMASFPNFKDIDKAKSFMSEDVQDINLYIKALGKKIFEDADNTGINRNASLAYVDACEAYALAYPKEGATPEYLFKAAEVAKSLRTFPKSLTLYDWVIEKYPNYEKAGTALFLKGFIIENNLGDDEKAREVYNTFLKKYPKHDLADDVQFLIENLGKTDEEILEMIESKQKKNQ